MIGIIAIFLVGCTVRCDELRNTFYVVDKHDVSHEILRAQSFKVYWNVPTMQCKSKGVPFANLQTKYGIIQNQNDSFHGDAVAILYDPGIFPALLKNGTSDKLVFRNGGVPQEGDLERHLAAFEKVLEESVPDKNFNGIGIIDFESWRPIFRQNFGSLSPYKEVSYEVENRRHRFWPQSWIREEAVRRFEAAGRKFMQASLTVARRARRRARWGYYGFPYCFNTSPREDCADRVPEENDRLSWLWDESGALYPSLYSTRGLAPGQLQRLVRGRVREARRVAGAGAGALVLPYYWYRYRDGGFITEKDLVNTLNTLRESNASGMVIWGSSSDVNTKTKCLELLDYLEKVLGPTVAKYVKTKRIDDTLEETNTEMTTEEINPTDQVIIYEAILE